MTIALGPPDAPRHAFQWWEYRWAVALLVLLSSVPLFWPDVPPLVDLPGHMGRFRVQLELATSPELQQYYQFQWALIGNLGIDLIVQVLAPWIGLETTVWLSVMAIPAVTAAGLLWVAREVHGRVPPTALFALPFAYNFPFLFGFVNFALSMGLALCAFALWLRLARQGRFKLRAAIFVPLSCLLWVCHTFGWGTLGIMAYSAELIRNFDRIRDDTSRWGWKRLVTAAFWAGIHVLPLVPPVVMMLAWRSNAGGQTFDWFNWNAKFDWLLMVLRDRWQVFDTLSLIFVLLLLAFVLFSRRLTVSRNLGASALFLLLVYILLPRVVFGSAYADMRLAPYIFAIALIAVRVPEGHIRFSRMMAAAGLAFFLVRTIGSTWSAYLYDERYDQELAALDHVPRGARLVSFIGRNCQEPWGMSRLLHLNAMATVRNYAFANDQWTVQGAQLMTINYPPGGHFTRDPSQIVTQYRCPREWWLTLEQSFRFFPRAAFDYVWLIDPPPFDPRLSTGLTPIWRSGTSVLYRVDRERNLTLPGARPTR